jgi:fructose-1,6-bisphosphatase/inositol monophosphatase family enzyme
MMMKLIDPICHEAHGIDAVFDVAGQKPHDVVPGAYIALKAGACMRKIDGTTLSLADLENALLRPADQRLKYVLTGTAALCDEMIQAFGLQDKKLVNNASTGT